MERLQKVMAEAGIASRRHCEELILDGQVKVNGKVVRDLPCFVEPGHDTIVVGGRKLLPVQRKVYYLLNKPKKVFCTNSDPQGRVCAVDLITGVRERVYPVGRLDADSQGLLLMTNDGELANQLTHPRYGVVKTYLVELDESITSDDVEKLKKGIHLEQGKASAEKVVIVRSGPKQTLLEIWLREGRNRQIRRMLARLGYSVKQLTRIRIGKLSLRGLGPGKFRPLTDEEVKHLRFIVSSGQKQVEEKTVQKTRKTAKRAPSPEGKHGRSGGGLKRPSGKAGHAGTKPRRRRIIELG